MNDTNELTQGEQINKAYQFSHGTANLSFTLNTAQRGEALKFANLLEVAAAKVKADAENFTETETGK